MEINKGNLITKKGYDILVALFEEAKDDRDRALAEMVSARNIPGEDNAELLFATEQIEMIDAKIASLANKISAAILVKPKKQDTVGFGTTVDIEVLETKEKLTIQIVGTDEIGYYEKGVSVLAPLATAIMGLEEGDEFDVKVNSDIRTYTILKIHSPE